MALAIEVSKARNGLILYVNRNVVRDEPNNSAALFVRGLCLYKLGKDELALNHFTKVSSSTDWMVWCMNTPYHQCPHQCKTTRANEPYCLAFAHVALPILSCRLYVWTLTTLKRECG